MQALRLAGSKAELRKDRLPTHGSVAELIARLTEHSDGWTVELKDGVFEVNEGTNAEVKAEVVHAQHVNTQLKYRARHRA
jgi:hypothetical protein